MTVEHTERMRVNWVDTDASGRIHYTAALRYFEVPEHAVMRGVFGDGLFEMPRVHVEADYQNELRYPVIARTPSARTISYSQWSDVRPTRAIRAVQSNSSG
jgi:acyl-CoA thioesterase FadM